LAETDKASERGRDLPAQVMVYQALAMALHTESSTREVLHCLLERPVLAVVGHECGQGGGQSGISQAHRGLGEMPLRPLHEQVVQPVATCATKGRGIEGGGWSAWMWPTRPRTARASGVRVRTAARARSRNSALWRCWRTARTCCSAPGWAEMAKVPRALTRGIPSEGAPRTTRRRCPPLPFHRLCRWNLRQLRP